MASEEPQVPDGAAVFPLIPEELGIHPLLLCAVHAVVFLDGSSEEVLNDPAADEALQYLSTYLQRLSGTELRRVREDMEVLYSYANDQQWPSEELQFLKTFLEEFGVGNDEQA